MLLILLEKCVQTLIKILEAYFLEVKWRSLSCVWLFATPWTIQSMEFSKPEHWSGYSERNTGAFLFSRGSSQPRDQTQVPRIADGFLPTEPQRKPKNIGVGSLSLLQRIFLIQESNWSLLHCRQILYQLSYQGSPFISYLCFVGRN